MRNSFSALGRLKRSPPPMLGSAPREAPRSSLPRTRQEWSPALAKRGPIFLPAFSSILGDALDRSPRRIFRKVAGCGGGGRWRSSAASTVVNRKTRLKIGLRRRIFLACHRHGSSTTSSQRALERSRCRLVGGRGRQARRCSALCEHQHRNGRAQLPGVFALP